MLAATEVEINMRQIWCPKKSGYEIFMELWNFKVALLVCSFNLTLKIWKKVHVESF